AAACSSPACRKRCRRCSSSSTARRARSAGSWPARRSCASLKQRPQPRPDALNDQRLRFRGRVNAVGLKEIALLAEALEYRGHERDAVALGELAERVFE